MVHQIYEKCLFWINQLQEIPTPETFTIFIILVDWFSSSIRNTLYDSLVKSMKNEE